jgi:hypothetical protein
VTMRISLTSPGTIPTSKYCKKRCIY